MVKAVLYGVQVFYSFFIMWVPGGRRSPYLAHQAVLTLAGEGSRLLFMTYNGWVMLAVAFGAFVGFLLFGGASSARTVACH